ncbi:hypothetical protein [Xanthomonas nasturtii]|uniref:hypothetical protein n=1 Tax=Xanthomonas nasturtii TaxID=1843581 RepID=UPI0035573E35
MSDRDTLDQVIAERDFFAGLVAQHEAQLRTFSADRNNGSEITVPGSFPLQPSRRQTIAPIPPRGLPRVDEVSDLRCN